MFQKVLKWILKIIDKGHPLFILILFLVALLKCTSLKDYLEKYFTRDREDAILIWCMIVAFVLSIRGNIRIVNAIKVYRKFSKTQIPINKTKRIVIMLPLVPNETDYHLMREVASTFTGIGHGLKRVVNIEDGQDYQIINGIELVFKDHKNDIEKAVEIIDYELSIGTRHFICTMSRVCIELSGGGKYPEKYSFNSILKNFQKSQREPIYANLVITIATSKHIQANVETKIYRLFPKAIYEADWIISYLEDLSLFDKNNLGKKDFILITTNNKPDHPYLDELYFSFKDGLAKMIKKVKNSKDELISIDIPSTRDFKKIENNDNIYKCKCIFILCKYSENEEVIKKIISKLANKSQLDPKFEWPYLVTPSALPGISYRYKDDKHAEMEEEILKSRFKSKWIYSIPQRCTGGSEGKIKTDEKFYGELADYFMNLTIRRVVRIITKDNYSPSKFDEIWKSEEIQNIPTRIMLDNENIYDPDVILTQKKFE